MFAELHIANFAGDFRGVVVKESDLLGVNLDDTPGEDTGETEGEGNRGVEDLFAAPRDVHAEKTRAREAAAVGYEPYHSQRRFGAQYFVGPKHGLGRGNSYMDR